LIFIKTLIEKYGYPIDTYKPLSIDSLSFKPSSAPITMPTPSPGIRTCRPPYKVNLRTSWQFKKKDEVLV